MWMSESLGRDAWDGWLALSPEFEVKLGTMLPSGVECDVELASYDPESPTLYWPKL